MRALLNADPEMIETMLRNGADPNIRTSRYQITALAFAIRNPNPLTPVTLLLQYGARPALSRDFWLKLLDEYAGCRENPERGREVAEAMRRCFQVDSSVDYRSLLPIAAEVPVPLDILESMLRSGVPPDSRNFNLQNASTALESMVRQDNLAGVELLLKYGANPNQYNYSDTPLLHFVRSDAMLQLLLDSGANLAECPQVLQAWAAWATPWALEQALAVGHTVERDTMIAMGAGSHLSAVFDLLCRNFHDAPPLGEMLATALSVRSAAAAAFLIDRDARLQRPVDLLQLLSPPPPNPPPGTLTTSELLRILTRQGVPLDEIDPRRNMTPLVNCVLNNEVEAVHFLLTEGGADPNRRMPDGTTALYQAVTSYQGNLALIRLLVENGADLNQRSPNGATLLIAAAAHEVKPAVIEYLLERSEIDVNAATEDDITALMLVA